jgi:hypothetical protein
MPRSSTSTQRRYRFADKILAFGILAMRPCSHCVSQNTLCVVSPDSEGCEQCIRFHRPCELASPIADLERIHKKEDDISQQIIEEEAKLRRLRKERRRLRKQLRSLGEREEQNIRDLEAYEAAVDEVRATKLPLWPPLNFSLGLRAQLGPPRFRGVFLIEPLQCLLTVDEIFSRFPGIVLVPISNPSN